MRWADGRRSSNVEDRRGGGGALAAGGIGLGTLLMAAVVGLLGGDPGAVLQQAANGGLGGVAPEPPRGAPRSGAGDRQADFVSVVLADTEDTWTDQFRRLGRTYEPPRLVLFDGVVASACGRAQASMGPFYCPADRKVYIDLAFYRQLREQLGAPGDFAQAYVIAHEVGHHVQNVLGIEGQVRQAMQRSSQRQANQLSVRLELQADCLAGVWAHQTHRQRRTLEEGDVEEAMNAASRIGDDALQQRSSGRVRPDSFTHGSSAQRQEWFARGLRSGDLRQCDTFGRGSA